MIERSARVGLLLLVCGAAWAGTASAQGAQSTTAGNASAVETRPATTTFLGDTGIWFVPTAEVLPSGKWSASGYRRGTNYIQGYTNVADFAGTFAVGVKDRLEVFGSFLADTRIDRDLRPLFGSEAAFGGIIDRYPRVATTWTGDNVGDLYLGAKVNILSEGRRQPVAIAVRGLVKLPTGKDAVGVSTGKADGALDFIVSKEVARMVEVSSFAGYEFFGMPDGFDGPNSAFRWGAGATFPSRFPLRAFGELNGFVPSKDSVTITGPSLVAIDGSRAPLVSATENLTRATGGLTFQARNGFFAGVGLSWNVPREARLNGRRESDDDPFADYVDWQFRIGFHPGTRIFVPPPPPAPPPPPPPPAAVAPPPAPPAHDLSVRAQCNPCTVNPGQNSTVTATVQDSISCAVTYRWSAPSGTFANASERQTTWTAPQAEGAVPITITVTCPSDNKMASDTVSIQVVRPVVRNYSFEDVHFDFDRYSLRPEATRLLDTAVDAMRMDATLRLTIEGHTCNIGTAEYNLALGDRRARAVKDYMQSRGISVDRLTTISYGEERPKYDNAREETRRLNRRAALVVMLTP